VSDKVFLWAITIMITVGFGLFTGSVILIDNNNLHRNDECQKNFNLPTKNTTLYKQKNIPHKGIKPARVVIECEVRK